MGVVRNRVVALLALTTLSLFGNASGALADGPGDVLGTTTQDALRLKFHYKAELEQISNAAAKAKAEKAAVQWETVYVANCPGNAPGRPNVNDFCDTASIPCQGNTPAQGQGPSVRIFQRKVDLQGKPLSGWIDSGITCFPDAVPGKPVRPVLTMQLILAAFHDTKFAKPTVEIQPKGNVTLVTLPTYFQVVWPQAGFQPDEIDKPDPARMAGFTVEIRPVFKSANYIYGDGTSSGPTESLGGPYPEGDITKEYAKSGTVQVRADVTYGGQFRVSGGQWIDIPAEVVIQGTPEPLQVKTAEARLVTK